MMICFIRLCFFTGSGRLVLSATFLYRLIRVSVGWFPPHLINNFTCWGYFRPELKFRWCVWLFIISVRIGRIFTDSFCQAFEAPFTFKMWKFLSACPSFETRDEGWSVRRLLLSSPVNSNRILIHSQYLDFRLETFLTLACLKLMII